MNIRALIGIFIIFALCGSIGTNVVQHNHLMEYRNELLKVDKELEVKHTQYMKLEQENFELVMQNSIYKRSFDYRVSATAYTARRQETNSNPNDTALMQEPVAGWTVAVSRDLSHLLGKRVWIDGVGVRVVNDLMNSRYTKRIDLLMGNVSEARQFGIQENVRIVMIEPEALIKDFLSIVLTNDTYRKLLIAQYNKEM